MLNRVWSAIAPIALIGSPAMAGAQVMPGGVAGTVGGVVGQVARSVEGIDRQVGALAHDANGLALARIDRLNGYVHDHVASVEADDLHQPARAHEVLLIDPDPAMLNTAAVAGFALIEQGDIDGLGISFARLATPPGAALARAIRRLRRLLPGAQISADQLNFASGRRAITRAPMAGVNGARAAGVPGQRGGAVGLIDGGVLPDARIVAQAGFASGAPRPDAHAQAIVSLLAGAGTARVYAADVYGTDPAGGNALAIARALGWLAGKGVQVTSISLVGPANPLVQRAIAAAQANGMIIAAPVGNDGAAAPLAYPASYDGVIAVTGVDGRGRPLFEAGRASHLDYAAPGADMTAIGIDRRVVQLRGTSFAAPLVAARLAALRIGGAGRSVLLQRADAEARTKAARTGRGVLCGQCRTGQ